MMRLFKKRRKDTFQTGKENGFRKYFRNWLSADGFGICRNRRTEEKSPANAYEQKQATESMYPLNSIAANKPGNVDLYRLLKKRSEQPLSDPPEKTGSGRSRSGTVVRKAVQE